MHQQSIHKKNEEIKELLLDNNLTEDNNNNNNNDNNNNINNIYKISIVTMILSIYCTILLFMYNDIHNMANNLDKIIDIINININTTTTTALHNDLSQIKDCVLNKYCKRVPS